MITKCLYSNFENDNSPERVKRHYIDIHKVDENNKLFINLLKPSDFLLHYGSGKSFWREKPMNYTTIGEIQKYEINSSQHSREYDFYNSESLVNDFL